MNGIFENQILFYFLVWKHMLRILHENTITFLIAGMEAVGSLYGNSSEAVRRRLANGNAGDSRGRGRSPSSDPCVWKALGSA